jgi:hypothetical protein
MGSLFDLLAHSLQKWNWLDKCGHVSKLYNEQFSMQNSECYHLERSWCKTLHSNCRNAIKRQNDRKWQIYSVFQLMEQQFSMLTNSISLEEN